MNAPLVVLAGVVLPGRSMAPPYASDSRCVIWAAAHDEGDEAVASGALPFELRADDGRELMVEPANATARFPVRLHFSFERPDTAAMGEIRGEHPPWQQKRINVKESRRVGWLAAGDRVTVQGVLSGKGAPFRGRQAIVAVSLRVEGEPALSAASLQPGEAEY